MTQHIRLYPKALSSDICKELIARFNQCPNVHRGVLGVGLYNPNLKRCTEIGVGREEWADLDKKIHSVVNQSLARYADDVPTFRYAMNGIEDTGYLLQKYRPGTPEGFEGGFDGFDWHSDVCDLQSAPRTLAMILYLNTVAEGGETEFLDQGLSVKPEEGALLWFPASFQYVHRGKTPISGPKYILTSFLVHKS